jgi:hypothetical protein
MGLKTLARFAAAAAFVLCAAGGTYILLHVGDGDDRELWIGIGLYFLGKAFFVGPMLLVAGEQLDRNSR